MQCMHAKRQIERQRQQCTKERVENPQSRKKSVKGVPPGPPRQAMTSTRYSTLLGIFFPLLVPYSEILLLGRVASNGNESSNVSKLGVDTNLFHCETAFPCSEAEQHYLSFVPSRPSCPALVTSLLISTI